jgi:hypothetical protein
LNLGRMLENVHGQASDQCRISMDQPSYVGVT